MRRFRSLLLIGAIGLALAPTASFAQPDFTGELDNTGLEVYGTADAGDIRTTIAGAIQALLGILGIVFLILIIYAGFLWMTAGGNSDRVKKARSLLLNSVIGLIIIVSAYAISDFVLQSLQDAANTTPDSE